MAKRKKLEVVTNDSQAFLNAFSPATVTEDGWSNPVAGMGILGRDKGASTQFRESHRLGQGELDAMSRDGFSMKIVGEVVDDAMRSGWVVTFQGDEDSEISPKEANEFNEGLQRWYKKVKLSSRVTRHLKQARHYGGAILALGVNDGQPPDQELSLERVKSFEWLRTHDRTEVSQSSQLNRDPTSVGFGLPEAYTLHSATRTDSQDRGETMVDTWVHNSRVWRTDGEYLSDRVRLQNQGWGDSALEPCKEQLGNRDSVMKGARTVVLEWVLGVYKIKDLKSVLTANGEDKVRNRFSIIDRVKSIWQSVVVDADMESFERVPANAGGLSEILDRFGIDLAAVAKMPMTKLFGLSPGGFGTGEAEGDNWDDQVKAYQTDSVMPLLEYIHTLLFATDEFSDFPKNWAIQFNSLQLTDPVEDADIRLKTAQKDSLEIASGVVTATEVAASRYGGATYSVETQLDEEERLMDEQLLTPEALEESVEGSGISVIGEHLGDVLGVLKDVTSGAMTPEAAKLVLAMSYPTVDPAEFNRLVDESEKAEPPPPPSIPFGPPPAPQDAPPNADDEASEESDEPEADEPTEPDENADVSSEEGDQ